MRSVADRRATFLWVVHRPSFLVDGNMCVGVIGEELIARVGPGGTEAALGRSGSRLFDFSGRR